MWWTWCNSWTSCCSIRRPYNGQIKISMSRPVVIYLQSLLNITAYNDYRREQIHLERWFERAWKSRTLHSFIQFKRQSKNECLFILEFSKEERVSFHESEVLIEQISGFASCVYDGNWWVASVLQLNAENNDVWMTFLHPHGSSWWFK